MSLQQYYDNFATGYWATEDARVCPCHGHGWALSEVDTWHKCRVHFSGQPHPEYPEDVTEEDMAAAEAQAAAVNNAEEMCF